MGKIILTSTGLSSEKAQGEFARLIRKDYRGKVIILTTAAEGKAANKYSMLAQKQFVDFGFEYVSFFDAEFDSLESLTGCRILYVCGGNTFYLLHHLRISGAMSRIKKLFENPDFIYVGVSAGSIVLGRSIDIASVVDPDPNEIGLSETTGLELLDSDVSPHYDPSHEQAIAAYEAVKGWPVIRISNDDAIVI